MNDNPNTVKTLEPPSDQRPEQAAQSLSDAGLSYTGFIGWLTGSLPTVVVLAALAGLAFWGHHTGWTIPSFATLTGNGPAGKEDWCGEHGVPESACVECQPDLMPRGKEFGWCKKHGIPECPFEHPEVAQLKEQPQIRPADLARAQRALDFTPRQTNNNKCKLHLRRIQFASQEAVDKAGIEVEPVWETQMVESVSANGEITYDQTRVARLSSRVPGSVWSVPKRVGDPVKRGEFLALVDAVEVGRAKAEFMQAVVQINLKNQTLANMRVATGAIPERTVQEAQAGLREAEIRLVTAEQALINLGLPIRPDDVKALSSEEMRQRMQFLGLPETISKSLDPKKTTGNLIPLISPLDGVVVTREVVAGEVVDSSKALFVVADLRQMWLTLNLRLEDTTRIAIGQAVRFRTDGIGDEVTGTVTWMSTAVDEKTRTVKVRADLLNADGRLRANTFGQGRIILREEENAVVVPNEAVHWEGDCFVVFVRDKNFQDEDAPKVFHVRKVRLGAKDSENTEIIAGVLPGELVATKSSGMLRAELLKNNLGES